MGVTPLSRSPRPTETDEEEGRGSIQQPLLEDDGTTTVLTLGEEAGGNNNISHQPRPISFFYLDSLAPETSLFPLTFKALLRGISLFGIIFCVGAWTAVKLLTGFQTVTPSLDLIRAWVIVSVSCFGIVIMGIWYEMRQFNILGPIDYMKRRYRQVAFIFGSDSAPAAKVLYMTASIHEIRREYSYALEIHRSILALYPEVSVHPEGARVHHAAGKMACALHLYDEALEYFHAASRLRQIRPSDALRATTELLSVASTYERMQKLEQALETRRQTLELLRRRGLDQSMDAARCLTVLASTYQAMGQMKAALEYFNQALTVYSFNVGDYPSIEAIARLYEKVGSVHAHKGDARSAGAAVENFRLAIEVYRRRGKSDESKEVSSLLRKVADLETSV